MPRAVLLALLVGLALPMGVAGVPTGGAGSGLAAGSIDEIAILTLEDGTRTAFATPSLDVATAIAIQREAASSRLDRYALTARFERTSSTEARKTMLFEAATAVDIGIASLRDDERALRLAYTEREIDAATLVQELARLHARATLLRTNLHAIQDRAAEIPQFSLRNRISQLGAGLSEFEGPVRRHALHIVRGDRPSTRLYVQASEQGAVLAMIEDDRFVREAYRADNRETSTVSRMSLNEADRRTSELYPLAYNLSNSITTGIESVSQGLFRIEIELREGSITSYLDGATGDVFFEIQERRLDLLGPRPAAIRSANGTRVAVNRSYAGGPLKISVTDNDTRVPREATVFVADTRLETGPDGTVWTLAPASVSFEVHIVAPGGNVTISVRQLPPTTVDDEG